MDAGTLQEISALYRKLIEAENRHDLAAVRTMVWNSPSTLFVAKTATAAQGNWAGFWGIDVVLEHLGDLYKAGPFRIDPDYSKEKVVGLTADLAETYAPVNITVAYAGQFGFGDCEKARQRHSCPLPQESDSLLLSPNPLFLPSPQTPGKRGNFQSPFRAH